MGGNGITTLFSTIVPAGNLKHSFFDTVVVSGITVSVPIVGIVLARLLGSMIFFAGGLRLFVGPKLQREYAPKR
jgi:hypothetical protein